MIPNWTEYPPGCGRHRLLAPDCRDCCAGLILKLHGEREPVILQQMRAIPPELMTPDPRFEAEEIRAVIAEPLGLPGSRLPSYDRVRPGQCGGCHGPCHPARQRCEYCQALAGLKARDRKPEHVSCWCRTCEHVRTFTFWSLVVLISACLVQMLALLGVFR